MARLVSSRCRHLATFCRTNTRRRRLTAAVIAIKRRLTEAGATQASIHAAKEPDGRRSRPDEDLFVINFVAGN